MADSAAVERAVLAVLSSDAALKGLMPDGVFLDVAPGHSRAFVILSLALSNDEPEMHARAYEAVTYLVKAVHQSSSTANAAAAAARIDALLEGVGLVVDGFDHLVTAREERIVYTEVDPVNAETRWQHQGGRYAVWVSAAGLESGAA